MKKLNFAHNPILPADHFIPDVEAHAWEDGRLYLYGSFDLQGREQYCSDVYHVYSTDDLVNWTDHGSVHAAGKQGAAPWANNSWAPAAPWKMIDGKPKFFLYFANSGGGIGVLTADSPTGPFTDPIGGPLVSRNTPIADKSPCSQGCFASAAAADMVMVP